VSECKRARSTTAAATRITAQEAAGTKPQARKTPQPTEAAATSLHRYAEDRQPTRRQRTRANRPSRTACAKQGVDQAVQARWIARSKHRESIVKKALSTLCTLFSPFSTLCTLFSPFFDVALTLFLTPSEAIWLQLRCEHVKAPAVVSLRRMPILTYKLV
jgi:hypothetical protein